VTAVALLMEPRAAELTEPAFLTVALSLALSANAASEPS
jgi:hypothetical protein